LLGFQIKNERYANGNAIVRMPAVLSTRTSRPAVRALDDVTSLESNRYEMGHIRGRTYLTILTVELRKAD